MKPIKLILILLIVIFALSCGQQDGGLFYSLEQEAAIYNGTLPDNITIGSMEKNAGYYFIAAGKFMYIAEDAADTVEWNDKNPDAHEEYLCYNMMKIDNKIYAVFYNIDDPAVKVFSIDVSSPAAALSWSKELSFVNLPDGETVIDFCKEESRIFVYTQNELNKYSVFSTDLATFAPATSNFAAIKEDLNAGGEKIKVDYDGTNYWLAAGNKVLKTDGTAAGTDMTPGTSVSSQLLGKGFGGIVCAETDSTVAGVEVYLTSKEGVMLEYKGGAWKVLLSPYDEDKGLFEPLYDIEHIAVSNDNDDFNIIIAGSEKGYYEMKLSSPDSFVSAEKVETELTTYNQFSSIELSEQVILDFYFDEESKDKDIFALCYNGGLWKNSFKYEISDRFWDSE